MINPKQTSPQSFPVARSFDPANPARLIGLAYAYRDQGPTDWSDVRPVIESTAAMLNIMLDLQLANIDYETTPSAPLSVVARALAALILRMEDYLSQEECHA